MMPVAGRIRIKDGDESIFVAKRTVELNRCAVT